MKEKGAGLMGWLPARYRRGPDGRLKVGFRCFFPPPFGFGGGGGGALGFSSAPGVGAGADMNLVSTL